MIFHKLKAWKLQNPPSLLTGTEFLLLFLLGVMFFFVNERLKPHDVVSSHGAGNFIVVWPHSSPQPNEHLSCGVAIMLMGHIMDWTVALGDNGLFMYNGV